MEDDEFVPKKSRDSGSLAPKRPTKRTDLPASTKSVFSQSLFSSKKENPDDSFGLSALSPSKGNDKCMVCGKVLTLLNEQRRTIHVNECLDQQETESKKASAMEKYNNTIDCPICRKPLPKGPYQIAHAKSCGKEHVVSGKSLVEMMDVQRKAAAIRKCKNLPHTSAPVPTVKAVTAPKLKGQPKSLDDEQVQLAMALSVSTSSPKPTIEELREETPQFTRLQDPNEKRRKRPKSFAVVEFAPRTCKCQVLAAIHTRFIDTFKVACRIPKKHSKENISSKTDHQTRYQRKLIDKTNRFSRLSDDFSSLFDKQTGADFHFICNDDLIPAHKAILLARTRNLPLKEATIRMDESKGIVSLWLRYVYSGRVEWSQEEDDAIVALAEKYGPETLCSIKSAYIKEDEEEELVTQADLSKDEEKLYEGSNNSEEILPEKDRIANVNDLVSNVVEEKSEDNIMEDTIHGVVTVNDGEDPMQGINLSVSMVDEADDDVVIINETVKSYSLSSPPTSENVLHLDSPRRSTSMASSIDIFTEGEILDDEDGPQPWHMTPLKLNTILTEPSEKSDKPLSSPPLFAEADDVHFYDDFPMNDDYYQPDEDYYQPSPIAKTKESEELVAKDGESPLATTPKSSHRKRSLSMAISPSRPIVEHDSFDDTDILIPRTPVDKPGPSGIHNSPPLAHSTPLQPVNKKLKFGSNVKIVKTTAITPMPDYERMDDARLKTELAIHGLRPMGKKKAVAKLKEIYEEIHPVIDPSTPTLRPLPKLTLEPVPPKKATKKAASIQKAASTTPVKNGKSPITSANSSPSSSGVDDLGNKTLNESDDEEPPEESMIDDPIALPKNMGEMTTVLLAWLRKPENEELYNHLLSLQPVLIDELHMRMSAADDAVCSIPKRALGSILDNLGATFSLPQKFGGRRCGGGGRAKKK